MVDRKKFEERVLFASFIGLIPAFAVLVLLFSETTGVVSNLPSAEKAIVDKLTSIGYLPDSEAGLRSILVS